MVKGSAGKSRAEPMATLEDGSMPIHRTQVAFAKRVLPSASRTTTCQVERPKATGAVLTGSGAPKTHSPTQISGIPSFGSEHESESTFRGDAALTRRGRVS